MRAYSQLTDTSKEIHLLSSINANLSWDQETYMPSGALEHRAEQLSYLTSKIHGLKTSTRFGELLQQAESEGSDSPAELANLREWRHHYDLATKLPDELVTRDSKTSSLAKAAWAQAKETGEFSHFAPLLEQTIQIAREKAEHWGYQDEPYDALLQCYERGAKTRDVVAIFNNFAPKLKALAAEAVAHSQQKEVLEFTDLFPIEQQKILNREVAQSLGFDFSKGRIDTTEHPFCTTLGPMDCRLTTRYDASDFTSSLFGVMHETGHGLYEQGLPTEHAHLPIGHAISLGIHESQSLLWEAHVGRSLPFWRHWMPRIKELFPQLELWDAQDILRKINRARYSMIRVDADEATYDLHIMLRFQIERMILNEEIQVNDIPDTWNQLFEHYFGLCPKNHSEGCLQDIHWSMGGLGYFATYTLGNLNASQLFATATKDPSIAKDFQKADYRSLLEFMRREIHQRGSTLLPQDLMQAATGETTNPSYHLEHIKNRYLD